MGAGQIEKMKLVFKAAKIKCCYAYLWEMQSHIIITEELKEEIIIGRGQNDRGCQGYRGSQKHPQYQANTAEEPVVLYAADVCTGNEGKLTFVLDSGASNHFVQECLVKYMSDVKILKGVTRGLQ